MTLSLYMDDEYQTEVGTTTGWGEFRRWAEKLDVDKYEALIHLVLYGWSQEAEDIKSQLETALDQDTPADKNVLASAKNLLESLDSVEEDSVIIISDGVGIEED